MSEETITVIRDELARIEATNVMLQQWVVERDARIAELEAERKRLLDWMGEAVSRVEQMGVLGLVDDADLFDVFREATEQAKGGGR